MFDPQTVEKWWADAKPKFPEMCCNLLDSDSATRIKLEFTEKGVELTLPTTFLYQYFRESYLGEIRRALHKVADQAVEVSLFCIEAHDSVSSPLKGTGGATTTPSQRGRERFPQGPQEIYHKRVLLSQYGHDRYIVGESNHIPYALVTAFANGQMDCKLLALHGRAGSGKTHLLQIAANICLEQYPDADTKYVEADHLVWDYTHVGRKLQSFDAFMEKYSKTDWFFVDELNRLAGRGGGKTELAFCRILKNLIGRGARVMTTSVDPARNLLFHDELRSRFELFVDVYVKPFDPKLQVQVLMKKAERAGFKLSEEFAEMLARLINPDARALERAIHN